MALFDSPSCDYVRHLTAGFVTVFGGNMEAGSAQLPDASAVTTSRDIINKPLVDKTVAAVLIMPERLNGIPG
ncbi:hypothetical protein GGF31_001637 [Allomyces arbusculus]|nr:hypothetical protein GGF31_001637 [Allomyces arbusculus]